MNKINILTVYLLTRFKYMHQWTLLTTLVCIVSISPSNNSVSNSKEKRSFEEQIALSIS